jgi:pimeloyl-ACP methyl ester carboxylesterase
MRELIHFAHGNGFPALCYKQFLNSLEEQFDYCYVDKIGHDPNYPVGDNWHCLVDQILASVKSKNRGPVIAVGHSLGGVLSLLAAIEEPHHFKMVILLDSPLIGPFKSRLVRWAKGMGMIDKITPASRTKGRRQHWENKEQLIAYLKKRDLFKTFNEDCLNDYVEYGIEHKEDGYHLRFDREIEYQIYRTIPHTIPALKGRLAKPAALIYGESSTIIDKLDRRYMLNCFNINSYTMKGTHLFPLEYPKESAKEVLRVISEIKSHQRCEYVSIK